MVYLCRNKRNGFVKIGFSKNPKYREQTLQAEEPDIFFERTYDGTMDRESFLHRRFAGKRIRGEWFDLTPDDIKEIDSIMAPKRQLPEETEAELQDIIKCWAGPCLPEEIIDDAELLRRLYKWAGFGSPDGDDSHE